MADPPGPRAAEAAASLGQLERWRSRLGRTPTDHRTVKCMDAVEYLRSVDTLPGDVVTSLPDLSEMGALHFTLEQWREWFLSTAELVLRKLPPDRYAIFVQSDIKVLRRAAAPPPPGAEGSARPPSSVLVEEYVDKGFLCSLAAHRAGLRTMWHRVETMDPVLGARGAGRPRYSHALCYSRTGAYPLEHAADVEARGPTAWSRGTGLLTCARAMGFLLSVGATHVVDPFCGTGAILAMANFFGLPATGIELSPRRCRLSRAASVERMLTRPFLPPGARARQRAGSSEDAGDDDDHCGQADPIAPVPRGSDGAAAAADGAAAPHRSPASPAAP